jgi:hypothetical protein
VDNQRPCLQLKLILDSLQLVLLIAENNYLEVRGCGGLKDLTYVVYFLLVVLA